MSFVDFVATLFIMRDKDLPNPWDSTKVSLAAVQKSVGEIFPIVVVGFIIQLGPVIAWIWTAIDHFICPMVLQITGYFIQNIFIACTYNFWTAHNDLVQINFTRRLTTGELTYEQAVAEYALVNKYRKAMSRALASASWSFQLYMLMMAVVLYDFEIRPWGGWHFALIYVMYAISLVLQLSPWFALHEWPNELCREMMESTELAWSPSDPEQLRHARDNDQGAHQALRLRDDSHPAYRLATGLLRLVPVHDRAQAISWLHWLPL